MPVVRTLHLGLPRLGDLQRAAVRGLGPAGRELGSRLEDGETGRIHLPRTSEAEATRAELPEYEIRVSDDGRDSFGAFRTGRHDDLVTALGLATQATPAAVYVY